MAVLKRNHRKQKWRLANGCVVGKGGDGGGGGGGGGERRREGGEPEAEEGGEMGWVTDGGRGVFIGNSRCRTAYNIRTCRTRRIYAHHTRRIR